MIEKLKGSKIIYDTEFAKVSYNKVNSLVIEQYIPISWDISAKRFDAYNKKKIHLLEGLTVEKAWVDPRAISHMLTEERQQSITEVVIDPLIAMGLKKMAVMAHPDVFKQVTIELTVSETIKKLVSHYFLNETLAFDWLLSDTLSTAHLPKVQITNM